MAGRGRGVSGDQSQQQPHQQVPIGQSQGAHVPRAAYGRGRAVPSAPGGYQQLHIRRPPSRSASSASSRSTASSGSSSSSSSTSSASSASSSRTSSPSTNGTRSRSGSRDSTSSTSGSNHRPESLARRLARRDSDVSSDSVASQNFATVEQSDLRAPLVKEPSQAGRPIQLFTNYVKFELDKGKAVYEYDVKFDPQIESISLRGKILKSPDITSTIGTIMQWSGTNLYLPLRLPKKVCEFKTAHPVLGDKVVQVTLTFIKAPPQEELLPFYNGLMRKAMNCLRMVLINRHYYSAADRLFVPQHKLEIWPGWVTSIQELDGGVLLSCDASFRILRTQSALEALREVHRSAGANFRDEATRALVGTIVMTKYNNKAYRVDDIAFNLNPKSTFMRGDTETTYADYFREHWNVVIQDLNQPMFIHRPKQQRGQTTEPPLISLVPELCIVTGLTDAMRSDYNVMREIASHTRLKPELRAQKMKEFLGHLTHEPRALKVFTDWNLTLNQQPIEVTGRRLPNESLLFGRNRQVPVPDNADWTRPATNGEALQGVTIDNWVIVYTNRDSSTAQDFAQQIQQVSRSMGFSMSVPRRIALNADAPVAYLQGIKAEVKPDDQLVVVLTPGKAQREDRYNAVKRLLNCDMPVPSQVLRCGTFQGPKARSVAQKIAIQILSKVGGQPWGIRIPIESFMIVGIDVYHDTLDKKRSCVGFVASTNAHVSQWYSRTFFQNTFEEICAKLKQVMIDAMRKYHSINGFPPKKVLIYRDGVGDGQIDAVIQFEVAQIVDAIRFYAADVSGYEPQISYVLVQKRISTKMILNVGTAPDGRGPLDNPLPGSTLDHTITHPMYNDFYLVSQHVGQGTVSPTKYIVLTETGTLKPEHHQKLAYKLTHMYYNWCGTVRVPAPCQYAHKLAYLVGQNIRQEPSDRLSNKLYYL